MLQVAACQFVGVYKPEKMQLDASCYTLVLDNVPPKKQQKGSHVILSFPLPPHSYQNKILVKNSQRLIEDALYIFREGGQFSHFN